MRKECDEAEPHENDHNTRIARLEGAVFGNGKLGIAQQNLIMWRFHVWILCLLSSAAGVAVTIAVHKFLKP